MVHYTFVLHSFINILHVLYIYIYISPETAFTIERWVQIERKRKRKMNVERYVNMGVTFTFCFVGDQEKITNKLHVCINSNIFKMISLVFINVLM